MRDDVLPQLQEWRERGEQGEGVDAKNGKKYLFHLPHDTAVLLGV